ncbi:iron reductase domain protein [Hyaloscypha variabilis]|uniref:Iron reductase domain protein n=1 Tax=Hyaloscypha variabilis (strain UAMH 11265 / GT02V1 / F) TaxID=1149755 RepID=A0A2J6S162_HYAVF|nr:iron reductase domain protein [Hyaloscypha variabilis F]
MRLLAGTVALLATAVSGDVLSWTESVSGVQYNVAIPETAAAPFDIYTSIVSPINMTWAALAFGGCMLRSPILVAWANGTNVAVSPRWATAYHPPAAYNGTTTTVLKTSTVNATHWKADIVCTGCSAWFGGAASIPALGSTVFGYGVSNHSLGNPALLSTSIPYHNVAKGHWELNITAARNSASDFTKLTTPA